MNRTPADRNAVVNSSSNSLWRNGPDRARRLTLRRNFAIVVMREKTKSSRTQPVDIGTSEWKLTTHGLLDASCTPGLPRRVQRLPFEIRVAATARDIAELVSLRSATYGRHKAPGAHFLNVAEPQDGAPDAILLVARSKVDGGVLGSVRIQTRTAGPLMVESAISLPSEIERGRPIELMRGSVRGGAAGRTVSAALAKASFLIASELLFTHIIVTCREPVDSMYRAYMFDDLLYGGRVHLPYSPGVEHRILSLPVAEAAERWRCKNAALYSFMVDTDHPDIQLDFDSLRTRLSEAARERAPAEA